MDTERMPLPPKLANVLERDRLERRERRLELVVGELRARAEARRAKSGRVPEPLGAALAGFQSELRTVRSLLRHMPKPSGNGGPPG